MDENAVDVRGQRRMDRLIGDVRKATVTQITSRYNQGLQNIISKPTTCGALKQTGYRGPQWVPLLSAKNRKPRLPLAHAHQKWTHLISLDFSSNAQMVGSEFGI